MSSEAMRVTEEQEWDAAGDEPSTRADSFNVNEEPAPAAAAELTRSGDAPHSDNGGGEQVAPRTFYDLMLKHRCLWDSADANFRNMTIKHRACHELLIELNNISPTTLTMENVDFIRKIVEYNRQQFSRNQIPLNPLSNLDALELAIIRRIARMSPEQKMRCLPRIFRLIKLAERVPASKLSTSSDRNATQYPYGKQRQRRRFY